MDNEFKVQFYSVITLLQGGGDAPNSGLTSLGLRGLVMLVYRVLIT